MKKILYTLYLASMALLPQMVSAKSMKDLLVSMPDSLVPYLNQNLRLEMAELQEMGVKAEVKNLFGEQSVMDTLATDFLQMRMSKTATLQIKKLPMEGAGASLSGTKTTADSLLCVVKTYAGPEKESELYLFDQDWQQQDASGVFDGKSLHDLASSMMAKPDSMSEERYAELQRMVSPQMVSALLLEHENSIVVRLALPLLSADDKKAVNAIRVQRKFNWRGMMFKES